MINTIATLLNLPPELAAAIKETKVVLRNSDKLSFRTTEDVPEGCIVLNAPRPLPGHKTMEGDFLHGIFYSFIDPSQPNAMRLLKMAKELDGWIVIAGRTAQIEKIAEAAIFAKQEKYEAIYQGLTPEKAKQACEEQIYQMKGETFGSIDFSRIA